MTCCPTCGHEVDARVFTDPESCSVAHEGMMIRLTRTQFEVFDVLLKRFPATVNKDRIYDALYSMRSDGGADPKIIDVLVCHIRRKIAPIGLSIRTSWGVGYALEAVDEKTLAALRDEQESRTGKMWFWNGASRAELADLLDRKMTVIQIAARMGAPYRAIQREIDRMAEKEAA